MDKIAVSKCRLCGSPALEEIYEVGEQYISGFWNQAKVVSMRKHEHRENLPLNWEKWPLTLILCDDCNLLQLAHNAPQEILYARHYWYKSGMNETMKAQLKDLVKDTLQHVPKIKVSDYWIDIGANDGTLLSFVPEPFTRVGIEPASNLYHDLSRVAPWSVCEFWENATAPKNAKVISAIGMLYDLEDPNKFVAKMKEHLHEDGIIVCQLMCLEQMLANDDIGNICHEHLEYYTFDNLVDLFERHDLEIYHCSENNVNGGSYRIFARHHRGGNTVIGKYVEKREIEEFVARIEHNREQVTGFIQDAVEDGACIWAYGASTKGNVILQYYGLDNTLIQACADRNPAKVARIMAGSGIPIESELDMRTAEPDYLLMLPYAFREEFIEREADWHERGGRWIIPLPRLEII